MEAVIWAIIMFIVFGYISAAKQKARRPRRSLDEPWVPPAAPPRRTRPVLGEPWNPPVRPGKWPYWGQEQKSTASSEPTRHDP